MSEPDILLVGAGPMALAYAATLNALGRDYSVCGRGRDSAERFAQQTNVQPGTGDLRDQLEARATRPDCAIVATGILDLPDAARALLDHGVARILIEKPGAVDVETMEALAAYDSHGRIRVAYNRRFLSSVAEARNLIVKDGGAQTVHFEFTELPDRVLSVGHSQKVLENWLLANSSHVIDLAFFLAGAQEDGSDVTVTGQAAMGHLDWHSPGSRFVGCGQIGERTLFSYSSDWGSGGGWGVEATTPRRRLRLRPLESLTQQLCNTFAIDPVVLPDETDLKPGLLGMLKAFLDDGRDLPNSAQQVRRMRLFRSLIEAKANG